MQTDQGPSNDRRTPQTAAGRRRTLYPAIFWPELNKLAVLCNLERHDEQNKGRNTVYTAQKVFINFGFNAE